MKTYPADSKEYKYLKKNSKLFLKKRYDLLDDKKVNERTGVFHYTLDNVDYVLRKYPNLFAVYWAKEEFSSQMLKLHSFQETK